MCGQASCEEAEVEEKRGHRHNQGECLGCVAQLALSEYETQARCIMVIWGLGLYGWMLGLCTGHYT